VSQTPRTDKEKEMYHPSLNDASFEIVSPSFASKLELEINELKAVHTYNGEPSEQFGLTNQSHILRWNIYLKAWCDAIYETLIINAESIKELGLKDRWMLQPPPLNEESK
jgi:hypothetical protein